MNRKMTAAPARLALLGMSYGHFTFFFFFFKFTNMASSEWMSENVKYQKKNKLFIIWLKLNVFSFNYSTDCDSSKSQSMADCGAGLSFWSRFWASTLLSNAFNGTTARVYRVFPCKCGRLRNIPNWRQSRSNTR